MDEIFQDFIQETAELIAMMEQGLLTLDEQREDRSPIQEIFRAAHTIKGTAAFLDVFAMADVTHAMEDLLQKMRDGKADPTDPAMEALFAGLDAVKDIHEKLKAGQPVPEDWSALTTRLLAPDSPMVDQPVSPMVPAEETLAAVEEEVDQILATVAAEINQDESPAEDIVFSSQPGAEKMSPTVQPLFPAARPVEETIRIRVGRLNNVINLIGELVTIQSGLNLAERRLHDAELSRLTLRLRKVLTRLRNSSLKLRMMPISHLFDRFPRLVRDLARKTGKKVQLKVSGGETEIDRNIIEELYDPLMHLIRNSIDHGLESPQLRHNTEKPETGTVSLTAFHQDNHVIVTVEDDGMGIDFDSVLRRATEFGLLPGTDTSSLHLDDIINLIFEPGFSTRKEVSEISGRGVGMDVVQSRIEALHGAIRVHSFPGTGTQFEIRLPLTLAITQVLLVETGVHLFGLPLLTVLETTRILLSSVEEEPGFRFFYLREEPVRLTTLQSLLGLPEPELNNDLVTVIIIQFSEQRMGIIIDRLAGKQEVVLKTLGGFLGKVRGIMGAAVLGDGRLVPVLETGTLIREHLHG